MGNLEDRRWKVRNFSLRHLSTQTEPLSQQSLLHPQLWSSTTNLDSIPPSSLHGWRQEGAEDGPSDVTTTPHLPCWTLPSLLTAQSGLMVSRDEHGGETVNLGGYFLFAGVGLDQLQGEVVNASRFGFVRPWMLRIAAGMSVKACNLQALTHIDSQHF